MPKDFFVGVPVRIVDKADRPPDRSSAALKEGPTLGGFLDFMLLKPLRHTKDRRESLPYKRGANQDSTPPVKFV